MMTGYVEVIVKLVNERNAGRNVQLCDFILRDVVQIFNQSVLPKKPAKKCMFTSR